MECPNCGSNKLSRFSISGGLFIFFLFFAFVPVIGWIVSPIVLLTLIAYYFAKKYKKVGKTMKCNECKQTFKISEELLKEHYTKIKNNTAQYK